MLRLAGAGLLGLLLLAPVAAAAPVLTLGLDAGAVTWGSRAGFGGELRDGARPRAGLAVRLETARLPGRRPFRAAGRAASTATDGSYGFSLRPDRGLRLRTRSDLLGLASPVRLLYVIPRAELDSTPALGGRTRIEVTLRVPRAVRLRGRAFLYVGALRARRLRFAATARVRRVGPGRFRAVRSVALDRAWGGSFRFGHCYDAPRATGLDDPRRSCDREPLRAPRAAARSYATGTGGSEVRVALSSP